MSSFKVTIERLEIHPHPNADALELAQVGLYRAVVAKGVYQTGDYALYIPEQAVLPPELIEELGLTGKLAGPEKNRVKAIRLRGELSQGIVCRPDIFPPSGWNASEDRMTVVAGEDYAEALGVTKWVPPVPVGMAGQVASAPELIRWIDIENIKRYPDIFEPGEMVVATEKVHGTCCLYTYDLATNREWVSSKGVGAQSLSILPDEGNLYWRAVLQYDLKGAAAFLCGYLDVQRIGIFGEVYGKGVQDLHYGADACRDDTLGYVVFDVACVDHSGRTSWLDARMLAETWNLPTDSMADAPTLVPLIYHGPYDYERLAELAEGTSKLHAGTIREGLVVRPMIERHSDVLGGRAIGKIVSEQYLLRKNATEFE